VAVSIDDDSQFAEYAGLFRKIEQMNMTCRVTVNITKRFGHRKFMDFVKFCIKFNIHQLLLRNITVPNEADTSDTKFWILRNTSKYQWNQLMDEVRRETKGKSPIATTPFGYKIFDVNGIAVVTNDYCIQDAHNYDDIRSLIFQQDGHVYTSWMSKASRIF
jgi:hypothetical protein